MSRKKKKTGERQAEVVEEFWTEIEFVCPIRGKVKQKVKGVRYKPVEYKFTPYAEEISEAEGISDEEDL